MEQKASVSLCMIVKNEEKYIEKCLLSVKDIVTEIIIVDTGSTDNTVEIADRFGAKISYFEWNGSFSDARNFSLSQATGDWLLLMDADEEFEKEDRDRMIDFVNHSNAHGCHFTILNYIGKRSSKQYTLHNAFRLLRNNGLYEYRGIIHEQICRKDGSPIAKGTFDTQNIRLYHYGYLEEVVKDKDKRNRNLPLLLSQVEKDPENSFFLFNLANEYLASGQYDKALSMYEKAYKTIDFTQAYAPHLVYRRAMTYGTLKQYEASVKAASEGLSVYSECTDLEFLRGMTYCNWGRYTLAIESFHKCMRMGDPPSTMKFFEDGATTRPLIWLGIVYYKLCDYEKALEFYTKAIQKDNTLYQNLYRIGDCLNKIFSDKTIVVQKLLSFFSSPSYVPNLIVLTDILIRQNLWNDAASYLGKMANENVYMSDQKFLKAKLYFYMRDYQNSYDLFESVLLSQDQSVDVLQNIRGESAEYLFVLHLLLTIDKKTDECKNFIKSHCAEDAQKLYVQILTVLQNNSESTLKENENWDLILTEFAKVLDKILKVQEFELFEKLLPVLNLIDSKTVLIFLAGIYHLNGFDDLAVTQVLRSIKELDYIDETGVEILARAYKK